MAVYQSYNLFELVEILTEPIEYIILFMMHIVSVITKVPISSLYVTSSKSFPT